MYFYRLDLSGQPADNARVNGKLKKSNSISTLAIKISSFRMWGTGGKLNYPDNLSCGF